MPIVVTSVEAGCPNGWDVLSHPLGHCVFHIVALPVCATMKLPLRLPTLLSPLPTLSSPLPTLLFFLIISLLHVSVGSVGKF
jgi:hypothetical protein